MTAQGLFIELRAHGQRVGLATVYRALHLLHDQGRVHEFPVDDGVGFLACALRPHHHLVCSSCGRVQESLPAELTEWVAQVEQDGFTVTTCTIEVRGICSRCRQAQQLPPAIRNRPYIENDNSYR